MVAAVRRGASMRAVAQRFHVNLRTVQRWVQRANGHRLDRVNWRDQSHIAHTIHRTEAVVEDVVLTLRRELRETSDLGEYGAAAIYHEMRARQYRSVPAVRTIGRILDRHGALDGRRRIRRPPPSRVSKGEGRSERVSHLSSLLSLLTHDI